MSKFKKGDKIIIKPVDGFNNAGVFINEKLVASFGITGEVISCKNSGIALIKWDSQIFYKSERNWITDKEIFVESFTESIHQDWIEIDKQKAREFIIDNIIND